MVGSWRPSTEGLPVTSAVVSLIRGRLISVFPAEISAGLGLLFIRLVSRLVNVGLGWLLIMDH